MERERERRVAADRRTGDIVRYGPNRISVNSISGLQGIYGAKGNVEKSDFYSCFTKFFKVPASVTIIDRTHHAIRRRITNPAFAMSAVKGMEGVMLDNIGGFCRELVDASGSVAVSGKDVREWSAARDVSKWISRLTFDIFGDLCFGFNWNTVKSVENRPFLEMISRGTAGLLLVSSFLSRRRSLSTSVADKTGAGRLHAGFIDTQDRPNLLPHIDQQHTEIRGYGETADRETHSVIASGWGQAR